MCRFRRFSSVETYKKQYQERGNSNSKFFTSSNLKFMSLINRLLNIKKKALQTHYLEWFFKKVLQTHYQHQMFFPWLSNNYLFLLLNCYFHYKILFLVFLTQIIKTFISLTQFCFNNSIEVYVGYNFIHSQ
jgi:hypothetical protein